jgi:DNA invertase Pin-like site-specific DNA recombinase
VAFFLWPEHRVSSRVFNKARLSDVSKKKVVDIAEMVSYAFGMDNEKVVAAIYSRVSTVDKGQDLTLQSDALKEYCGTRGWDVLEYADQLSAAKVRPGLTRMLLDARQGKFSVLVVWKLDRLFRSVIDAVTTLDNLSTRCGVRFVSLQDGLDVNPVETSPMVRFQMQLFASLAELERGIIRQRVKAGMDHARAKGTVLGRPKIVMDGARVKELRDAGRSWSQIAKEMGQDAGACRRAYVRYVKTATEENGQGQEPNQ